MPWLKWLPWRFAIAYFARAHGFLDPVALMARLHSFAQPSEVSEPVELLRAGVVFHARGLINSRVIQHNMDWVWPYWIERQFDPLDAAFIPRAFSITHVNLTHRNWTAVGLPDCTQFPIIDPRGLLTPLYDGWSLDGWVITEDKRSLLPSRASLSKQQIVFERGLAVSTTTQQNGSRLLSHTEMHKNSTSPVCHLRLQAQSDNSGWLVLALRPYNPEGISFVHKVALNEQRTAWTIDDKHRVEFNTAADRHHVSDYKKGDVYIHLLDKADQHHGECDVGMLTAAAMFSLQAGEERTIDIKILLPNTGDINQKNIVRHRAADKASPATQSSNISAATAWEHNLQGQCRLQIPDQQYQFLYDAALRTLVLHSPGDVYPGPYTYKRFWFRDAAFIVHALLCAGFVERAERVLDSFPGRQTTGGYFHSQEGEWDANGEVLWIIQRFCELSGHAPKPEWRKAIKHGARWINRKRLSEQLDSDHAGLLPAGFSAEHLGPNDYYYWDDFWGIAGLRSAATLFSNMGDDNLCIQFQHAAATFEQALSRSLANVTERLGHMAMPASPYRRMDAGAIGSLVTGYPLQLCAAKDPRLLGTVKFLLNHCFVNGGFFQDMIHSGINPYLTLHVAQVLLRAEDPRYLQLMQTVARLASPTGQWPEAIHPSTGGGCMGYGQHVWAAAEWVLMLRNCFVREEGKHLILGAGIAQEWLAQGTPVSFGPAPTAFGAISITIDTEQYTTQGPVKFNWRGDWHTTAPRIDIRLPGFIPVTTKPEQHSITLVPRAVKTAGATQT